MTDDNEDYKAHYQKLFDEMNARLAKSSAARSARREREIAAFKAKQLAGRKSEQLDKIEALANDQRGDANVRAVAQAMRDKLRRL